MKMAYRLIVVLIIIIVNFAACKPNYIDEDPQSNIEFN